MPDILYPNGTEVIINIDQGNMLKPNCGIDKNGNGNFTLAVQAKSLGIFCFVKCCLYMCLSLSPSYLSLCFRTGKWVESDGTRTVTNAITTS
jgi:hypothetical protein